MIQFENAVKKYNGIILGELKKAEIKCWIAGGALRDYFMGIPIKTDYDIFFPNETEYEKARTYFNNKNAEIKWESDNGMKIKYNNKIYDLVKIFFPDPQTSIEAFDFTVCMIAIDNDKVYHGETTFIDLAKRQLIINKITYPASTLSRAFRYYKKGFTMCLGEMKRLIKNIQEMPKEVNEKEDSKKNENESSGEFDAFFNGID